jgi:DNA-directed RNA polymerase specialized sigma subunit
MIKTSNVEKRKNRSEKYQHILLETSYSHEMLDHFSNEDSVYAQLNPFDNGYDERILDLKEQLLSRMWKLISENLTSRQKKVLEFYAKENMTQMEIAKALNVNQSSVTKSLNGNVDYRKGKKSYGGSKKKIIMLVENDPKIKKILEKINQIQEDKW